MEKITRHLDQELAVYLKERDEAFIALDLTWARKQLDRPTADEHTLLIALHKGRIASNGITNSVKKESRHWLTQHGYQEGFQ